MRLVPSCSSCCVRDHSLRTGYMTSPLACAQTLDGFGCSVLHQLLSQGDRARLPEESSWDKHWIWPRRVLEMSFVGQGSWTWTAQAALEDGSVGAQLISQVPSAEPGIGLSSAFRAQLGIALLGGLRNVTWQAYDWVQRGQATNILCPIRDGRSHQCLAGWDDIAQPPVLRVCGQGPC